MRNSNNTHGAGRWQDLSLVVVGALLAVLSTIDPDGMWLPQGARLALLIVGATCIGGVLLRIVLSTARAAESSRNADQPGEDVFERRGKTILSMIFVIHVVATLFFFPPRDIVNTRPVVTLDHAFHFYQVHRASEIFWTTGRLHAYDPYFMAGYPSALFDLDVKAAELFCSPFRGGAVAVAFKLFILACYLTIVFTVYKGCRYLGLNYREAILGVVALLVYWHWGRPYASHFRYAGMFEFICISHLSVLVVGLFKRFLRGKSAAPFFIFGPLAFLVHPTAVVILSVPVVLTVFAERRWATPRRALLLFVWCLCVVAVNAVWVVPFFQYAHTKTASEAYYQTAGLSDLIRVLFRPSCLPAILLLVLTLPGAWQIRKSRRDVGAALLFVTVVFLLLVTAYGVYLPGLRQLEPGRFLLTALFLAAPLSGAGAAWLWDTVGRRIGRRPIRVPFEWGALTVLVIAPVFLSFLSAHTAYKHKLSTTLSGEVRELIEAVNTYADTSGRLMIEDGPAALYGDTHLPGILPAFTGLEQIGGPYPFTFLEHHFATFQSDKTMGQPLSSMSAADFWGYVDLYNVGWIVTASAEGEAFVSRVSATRGGAPRTWNAPDRIPAEVIWESGRHTLWSVNRPRSFTGNPDDRVRASFNRIEIDLETVPERFLLRYHWDEGLVVSSPATVNPVYQFDDPVPFMLVVPNGASSISIKY